MSVKKKARSRLRARRGKIGFAEHLAYIARRDSVSVGGPQIADFRDPSLREVFRTWWHPIDMGADFDEMTGQRVLVSATVRKGDHRRKFRRGLVTPGFALRRRELDPNYYKSLDKFRRRAKRRGAKRSRLYQMPASKLAVRVVIVLDYPLNETRTKVVTIDRRYPGAIFGLVHDFYRELYSEDEKLGGKSGPMNDGKGPLLNRGRGPLVWGHDLGDLVFEGCFYQKLPPKEAKQLGAEGAFKFWIGS